MDDDQQENVADASLLLPQDAAGGVLQVPSGNSLISRHQLGSSDNSGVRVSPRNAGRRRKRKNVSNSTGDGTPKKIKVYSADQGHFGIGSVSASRHDVSLQLPAEVWQHIFSFLPPHTLGVLLRVSKLFNKYLDPASPFMISAPEFRVPSTLPALLPDAVWRASRYLFWPRMPAPLSGRSELDMWRFACSRSCQICGQVDETNFACNTLPWQRGPGNSTVSPIFVFFVKCCGKCLVQTSVKEVDVLLSTSIPSVLLPGLPMAFLTADLNVVYTQSIKTTQVPTSVPLTRIYWPAQVESLRLEFEDVKRFGPAAAGEWIKGLESRGADAIHQASRWEKWYLASGFSQMLNRPSPTPPQPIAHGAPKNVEATIRPKRRAREVTEELRSQRRADIERRAGQLRPPIPPDALVDLPSFQMSLEKAEPLRDKDWNQLKQQLVSQHKKMKGAEELAAKASEEHQGEHDAETLVKIHISGLTDQFISGHLVEGQSIEQNDYGQFLVGVMAYVRKEFYAEVSKIDTRYHSVAPPRLTLGDMVWIFDHKIKQRLKDTDQDLCSCRKCPGSKLFKFHALIHHYLSKHAPKTKTIKLRERLRIEWPRDPLFESSPIQQAFTADPKPLSPRISEMDDTYKPRIDAMAKAFKNVSKIIRDVKDIPVSIEVFVLIYHVAKELTNNDSGLVSLETFVDVLNHFKTSSILATYHGLACKICMLSETRDEDEKSLFTLPGLAKHFHNVHGEGDFSLTDWRADLIWLPGLQKSQDLQSKIRRSKCAFEIISEALPWLCESEGETSQGDPIPPLTNSPTNGLEAVNTASSQPDERSHGDVPRLLPASAVYVRSDTIQEQARYDTTVVARATSTNERVPQGYEPSNSTIAAHRIATEGSSIWGSSRTNSQIFSPREIGPAPGRHLSSYRPHDDYDVQMVERPNAYPYYPDLELRREQSHAAAGSIPNGSHSRYYIRSDHQQLIPSARLYHYGEPVAPYDRHDGDDARRVSNGYYTQHPGMIREYRVVSNADRFDYARMEPHRSITPSQRAYDTYASRYAPANRWPEF